MEEGVASSRSGIAPSLRWERCQNFQEPHLVCQNKFVIWEIIADNLSKAGWNLKEGDTSVGRKGIAVSLVTTQLPPGKRRRLGLANRQI